jgi:cytochrome oxidase Cu insertion factor (SCO1/SenC/PrrC family)
MQRAALLFTLLVGFALGAAAQSYPKPQIASASGKPAPDFTLQDSEGKPFTLSQQRGRNVILYFYRGYW